LIKVGFLFYYKAGYLDAKLFAAGELLFALALCPVDVAIGN
jgi:hypothetical protein